MELPQLLWETELSTIADVLPIAAIIFGFHLLILRQRIPNLKSVLIGFIAARTKIGWPLVMPPSSPPALFDRRRKPRVGVSRVAGS